MKPKKNDLNDDVRDRTREVAGLYFQGIKEEKPFELWQQFDSNLARELSLFITGRMYGREKIPHTTRQLVTVAVLTALGRTEELRLHILAALNVGCPVEQIAEAIFQTFTYAGIPTVNAGLKVLRSVLKEKGMWPLNSQKS